MRGLRPRTGPRVMQGEYVLGLVVAVAVTAYLVYALLRPEKF
ncbi:MAG: K(+)-transporting ATPase subunit F [Kofleriaceae bacterium]